MQEQLAEIILRAMEEEARRRLLSLFIQEKEDRMQKGEHGEIEQLERERDCGEGSSSIKVETSKRKVESSSDIESASISVSDSEIECSVDESEYSEETSDDDSDCSSQVSVIMRAPKTAVLNWLKGIEVSEDKKVKGAGNEIGNPRQHSHDREGDETTGETTVLNWLKGIQEESSFNKSASRTNHQHGNPTQEKCTNPSDSNLKREMSNSKIMSVKNESYKENVVAIPQKVKSPCNHQHSFDFVEEEMTFIINVMPEEPTFEPLYKEHPDQLFLRADISETPLTTFAPHRFDQTPESSLAIECETERLYKKENKKPSSLVENRLSCINEDDESQQRQQLENETVCLPNNTRIDGDKEVIKSYIEGEEICHLPEIEEEDTNEEESEAASKFCGESERQGKDIRDDKVLDTSHPDGKIKSREAGTCTNGEAQNTDQEPSILLKSLSLSCYELEDVEEDEFEYIEVENKIESFQGSIGFAIFRRKN